MRRGVAAAAIALGIAAGRSPAAAEPNGATAVRAGGAAEGQIVGVLELDVEGVTVGAATAFERSLEEGLGMAGFRVATRARMHELLERTDYVEGCLFGPCLATVFQHTEVRLVLVARIRGIGRSYSFVATLLDTRTGTPTSQVADSCAVCTVDEAMAATTRAAIALVTGTGEAQVLDPAGPTGAEAHPLLPVTPPAPSADERLQSQKRALRRTGYFMLGLAVIAGGVSVVRLADDDKELGYPAAAAGGAFALGAAGLFVLSTRY